MLPELPAIRNQFKKSRKNIDNSIVEQEILRSLIPHQRKFVEDFTHKYVALCGGYGCLAPSSLVDVWDGNRYTPTPIIDLCSQSFQVRTLAGPAWASAAYRKGFAPLYRVQLQDGKEFLATKDHRCLSPSGWVEVGHLVEGSLIAADGTAGDTHSSRIAKDCLTPDPQGLHSCDELRSPWGVFVREQLQQLALPNSDHCPSPLLWIEDCVHHSVLPWLSANHAFGGMIEQSSHGLHSVVQCLLHQHWSLDILLLHALQLLEASSGLSAEQREYLEALERAFSLVPCRPGSGISLNTLSDTAQGLAFAVQGSRLPSLNAVDRACGLAGHDMRLLSSTRPPGRSECLYSPADVAGGSSVGLPGGSRQACLGNALSTHSTWLAVERIEAVESSDFYDLHVPVLNHYFADGVIHHNSGKSVAAVAKSILLAFRSPGFTGIFLEPTIPLLRDVAIPAWEAFLERFSIPYDFRVSPLPNITLKIPGGDTPIFMRSLENVERLIGVNAAWIIADEIDTVKEEIATKAIIKLQGRVRVGNCRQIGFATTPEGYRFMHKFFVREAGPDKYLIKAKTTDNPYLDPDYAENLRKQYPPQLVESYLNGEFVNLATATVFSEYDRYSCKTAVAGPDHDELVVVGADFNIGRSMSVYGVIRSERGTPVVHIFGEHQANDTFALAQHLRRQYTNQILLNNLVVYPDASGGRMQTSSTTTDHQILRDAGIRVITERKNPAVQETIQHTNALFHAAQIRINTATCPNLVACCLEWGYDENLRPEKGTGSDAHDHIGDALRYLAWGALPSVGRGSLRSGPRWR